ncbi:MAG: hypothetical protein NZ930_03740 [Candidatus Bipolaricaulota bacterium]|nr:hypothetical protein [Candidatus Bipolaricaulota bacterium]MDW8031437.1 hypothetical protein [Candidatus Bipolaricaulota bacterium]
MHDHELENLLRESLTRYAQAHRDRIADLEYEIIEELPEGRPNPRPRLGVIAAGVVAAAAVFAVGLWIGLHLSAAPCSDPDVLCLVYPDAQSVSLAAQFTLWEPIPMNGPDRSGIWWIRLPKDIKPGRYEYGFIVNGTRWVYDPRATEFVHTFDNKINSVLYVVPREEREQP